MPVQPFTDPELQSLYTFLTASSSGPARQGGRGRPTAEAVAEAKGLDLADDLTAVRRRAAARRSGAGPPLRRRPAVTLPAAAVPRAPASRPFVSSGSSRRAPTPCCWCGPGSGHRPGHRCGGCSIWRHGMWRRE
jgi:hypothetical protein